jgi:hypothetical protein
MLASDSRRLGDGFKRTGQEAVELYQELEVHIVALGRLAVSRADVVAVEIDTYRRKPSSAFCFQHAQAGSLSSKEEERLCRRKTVQSFHSHT